MSPSPHFTAVPLSPPLAADAKKEAKHLGGSVLYLTRRRRPTPWEHAAEEATG